MRILFFGTSAFAVPALAALRASLHTVVGIVTQPDRPAGRGRKISAAPVAEFARAQGMSLIQPPTLKDDTVVDTIRALQPECIVVVAYGKFLPKVILDLPPRGCINIHPSLLPKYRGAAPINWAILNGDTITGVSTMYLVEEMDAGDVLLQCEVAIHPDETAAELHDRLAPIGAELLVETLDQIAAGRAMPRPQDLAGVVMAPPLTKKHGQIDWHRPAVALARHVRGMQPWPNAYTVLHGARLTIFRAEVSHERTEAVPGTVTGVTRAIHVATGDGQLCLTEVQSAGSTRMSVPDFLRGHPVQPGIALG